MKRLNPAGPPNIKASHPAPYARTTASELRSVTTFWGLVDHDYIKGKPEAMDKNPNDDGVFEFTSSNGTPIGKFAVQIKTLAKRNYEDPKYQCKLDFLAYCYHTNLPVILVAVNQEKGVVHWRHMDVPTIEEAQSRITKQSITISFPQGNVIAFGQKEYIAAWQSIVEQDVLLRRNADEIKRAHEELEANYVQLRKQLAPPSMLSTDEIAAFQYYLDEINFVLDYQFPVLKTLLFPNYWKIGAAVANMAIGERSHFLIPIAYGSSELPVRQFELETEQDMFDIFHLKGAIVLVGGDKDRLLDSGKHRSYAVLKSNLLRTYQKIPLFVPNSKLAQEYIAGFVLSFYTLLGLEKKEEVISLKELQLLITVVLPLAYETSPGYIAEGVKDLTYSIDGEKDRTPKLYYKERIMAAKGLLDSGYLPRYQTTLYSQLFSVSLLQRYIGLLLEDGQNEVSPIYATNPLQRTHVDRHIGIKDLVLIKENLRVFFNRFLNIYEQYLQTNFLNVKEDLDFFNGANLLVFVLQTKGNFIERPFLMCYRIHDERMDKRRMLFYVDTDVDNPIDTKRWTIDRDPGCTIYGQEYIMTSSTNMVIDFLFERSPTYAFIQKQTFALLEKYLEAKSRNRHPITSNPEEN